MSQFMVWRYWHQPAAGGAAVAPVGSSCQRPSSCPLGSPVAEKRGLLLVPRYRRLQQLRYMHACWHPAAPSSSQGRCCMCHCLALGCNHKELAAAGAAVPPCTSRPCTAATCSVLTARCQRLETLHSLKAGLQVGRPQPQVLLSQQGTAMEHC
jgi:hypothetical protein